MSRHVRSLCKIKLNDIHDVELAMWVFLFAASAMYNVLLALHSQFSHPF